MAGKKIIAEVVKEEPKKKAGRKPAPKKAVEKKVIDTEAKIVDVLKRSMKLLRKLQLISTSLLRIRRSIDLSRSMLSLVSREKLLKRSTMQ